MGGMMRAVSDRRASLLVCRVGMADGNDHAEAAGASMQGIAPTSLEHRQDAGIAGRRVQESLQHFRRRQLQQTRRMDAAALFAEKRPSK